MVWLAVGWLQGLVLGVIIRRDTLDAEGPARVTTFEQAWRDGYGTPEAWERERHGTAQEAQREVYGTPLHWRHRRESAEVERLRRERAAQ